MANRIPVQVKFKKMENKISVVMCTFNGEKYLKEQIESIINQTYPVHELIIQDDCSTDHTMDILRKYEREYTYIHVFSNEKQKGINDNFFSAMARATSDYIAISDQDDIWELDKIERQMEAIGDNWLSGCFSKPFAEGDDVTVHFDQRKPNVYIERLIYMAAAMPGHTLLLKKSLIDLVPCENSFLFYDHLLSITAASYEKISFLEKVLVHQRRHLNAVTYIKPINIQRNIKNFYHYFIRTLSNYVELRNEIRSYFQQMYNLLEALPEQGSVKSDAQKLALYQSEKGIAAYVKLTALCVKLRKKIFHTEEKSNFVSILRAIYFPISCSDYFRNLSKKQTKNKRIKSYIHAKRKLKKTVRINPHYLRYR